MNGSGDVRGIAFFNGVCALRRAVADADAMRPAIDHAVAELRRFERIAESLHANRSTAGYRLIGVRHVSPNADSWHGVARLLEIVRSHTTSGAPVLADGAHRLYAARHVVRRGRHRTLTSAVRHAATGPVNRTAARRFTRAVLAGRHGSLDLEPRYQHDHGTDAHTTGDRAGTRVLGGSSTPAAPPAAA